MGVTIDYTKTIPKDVQEVIFDNYSRGKTVTEIALIVNFTRGVLRKFLLQTEHYIFQEQRVKGKHLKLGEKLVKQAYSIYENDYGTSGKGKYEWNELSYVERRLASKHEHNQLKQWK